MNFEQAEQTRRLVVVTALNALLQGEQNVGQRAILKNKLRAYAFPEDIDLDQAGHEVCDDL